jgi:hypothetical protein
MEAIYINAIPARAFRTFIRIYHLFKNGQSSTNIKLTHHKALIRYAMSGLGICSGDPSAEIAVTAKQNLHTTGNFPMCALVRLMHVAFHISYVYDYKTT